MLENVGIEIALATSTNHVLSKLSQSVFSLVISDIGRGNNPRAGLDLLESINEKEWNVPMIIYSSIYAIDKDKYGERAKELGAVDTINGVSPLIDQVYAILKINPIEYKHNSK